jgi:Rieske Fe-S protein
MESSRRSWLRRGVHLLGGLFGAMLGIPAVGYLIDPRNRGAASGSFKPVLQFSELLKDVPHAAVVRDVRRDAWTLHPNDELGRVWLVWRGEKREDGSPLVEAYTNICPHLGGPINFEEKSQCFVCPFHGATFDVRCQRVSDETLGRANPAPRNMDQLEVELEPDPVQPEDFVVKVKYESFMQGKAEKIHKS